MHRYQKTASILVSPEAIGFLTAVGFSTILLLLLLVYINRKMCHGTKGGFHCSKSNLGRDLHGSSSESEDEAVGKYHEAMTRLHTSKPGSEKQQNYMWETRSKYSPLSAEYDGYSSEVSADEGVRKSKDLAKISENGTDVPEAEEEGVGIDKSKDSADAENSDVKKTKASEKGGKSAAKVNKSSGRATDDSAQNKKKKDRKKKNKKNAKKIGCCG